MWVGTATVAVLAGMVYLAAVTRKPAPIPERPLNAERILISSAMSLSAVRTEGGVSLTWDATTPAIRNARVGVLSVRDAGASREIPLNQTQLQAANLVYMPQSDRLEVALEVFSAAGEAVRESMIVAVTPFMAQPKPAYAPLVPTPSAKRSAPQEEQPSEIPTRRFVPPIPRALHAPSETVLLGDAPPVPVAQLSSGSVPFRPLNSQLPRPPQAPPIQPRIVRQVRPTLPSNITALIRVPTQVRVRVKIDARGNVTEAEALNPSTSGVNGFLTHAALDAARSWTFIPARQGSVAVASEMVLSFAFGTDR